MLLVFFLLSAQVQSRQLNYCSAPLVDSTAPVVNHKLLHVLAITRHGDRSAVRFVPGHTAAWPCVDSPEELKSLEPGEAAEPIQRACAEGELTVRGLHQQFEFGKSLRKALDQFLSPGAKPIVYARSTDVPRCIQSAKSHLRGFGVEAPIEVRTADNETMNTTPDFVLLKEVLAFVVQTPAVKKRREPAMKAVMEKLSRLFPGVAKNELEYWAYFDQIQTRRCHGIPMPGEAPLTDEEIDMVIDNLTEEHVEIFSSSVVLPLFYRFLAELDAQMALKADTLLYSLFMAHDLTMFGLLGAFGIRAQDWPPFASHFIFEVFEREGDDPARFIRFKYNGDVVVPRGCQATEDGLCHESIFKEIVASTQKV